MKVRTSIVYRIATAIVEDRPERLISIQLGDSGVRLLLDADVARQLEHDLRDARAELGINPPALELPGKPLGKELRIYATTNRLVAVRS